MTNQQSDLLQRAKETGLEAADGEVEDKSHRIQEPYTEDEFQRQLKARGYTVDDLKVAIRQQLSIQKVITVKLSQDYVTDQMSRISTIRTARNSTCRSRSTARADRHHPDKDPGLRNRKNDDATPMPKRGVRPRRSRATQYWRGLSKSPWITRKTRRPLVRERSGIRSGVVAGAK